MENRNIELILNSLMALQGFVSYTIKEIGQCGDEIFLKTKLNDMSVTIFLKVTDTEATYWIEFPETDMTYLDLAAIMEFNEDLDLIQKKLNKKN